ncbi:MAG: hypothetical protein A3A61_02550 [Candidatus Woykebacteria bacterium RIFCSPLOWO2_01_FULL_43_14]|uniref:Uncharacterized protein n=1 Tax=Candidatus Woykebacteria bacterium RIFCSPLOWO2_01_FULL_43_14 TaxID=1802605 RepID=A0A1G1WSH8_9BACT|nr:MAG: hypothetical protein A3A61_02550 [Candidatus Woykebacteria bacterium RIFCSPLOWO2_01_FULL_43_14]
MTYSVVKFLRHWRIFIGVLFGVGLLSGFTVFLTTSAFYRPQIEVRQQIVERTVVVTAVVMATSTSAPARAPTPTAAPVVAAPTAVPPTAVPAPTTLPPPTAIPAPTAIPSTAQGTILRIGETWVGEGMTLRMLNVADRCRLRGAYPPTCVIFEVQNLSGSILNFNSSAGSFFLELSTGKRFPAAGLNVSGFNDFRSGATQSFEVQFPIDYDNDFQAIKRDPKVKYYTVGVRGFNDRLAEAHWREEVTH